MDYLFWSCWPVRSQRPKTIPMLLASLQNSAVRSAEDTTHLSHRTWRNKVGTDLGTSYPLTTFHGAGRRSSCYMLPGRKVITNPIYLWTLWATIMTDQARHTHWCNSCTNITGILKHFLTAFESHSVRWNPYPGTIIRPRGHRPSRKVYYYYSVNWKEY